MDAVGKAGHVRLRGERRVRRGIEIETADAERLPHCLDVQRDVTGPVAIGGGSKLSRARARGAQDLGGRDPALQSGAQDASGLSDPAPLEEGWVVTGPPRSTTRSVALGPDRSSRSAR